MSSQAVYSAIARGGSDEQRIKALEDALSALARSADRMLAGMGKGREPSPNLQAALDRARELVPTIDEQISPRGDAA